MASETKTVRDSGPELLRILCMLLVVAHHYVAHGPIYLLSLPDFCAGTVFLQLFGLFGRAANCVFVLLSGYFLLRATADLAAYYRRLVRLLAQYTFYTLFFAVLAMILGWESFSGKLLLKSALPALFGVGNWFLYAYVWFFLFSPFVNRMLLKGDRRTNLGACLILQLLWCVIPTLSVFNLNNFGNFGFFLVWYWTGGCLRLYLPERSDRKKCGLLLLGATVLQFATVLIPDGLALLTGSQAMLDRSMLFQPAHSLTSSLWALAMFLTFRRLPLQSKAINRIAGHVMAVYLIHDNEYLRHRIWGEVWSNAGLLHSWWLPVHALGKVLLVFLLCVAFDLLREWTLGRWIEPGLLRLYDRLAPRLRDRAKRLLKL